MEKDLLQILSERQERISKAKKVKSLIQKQKGLMKSKQSLTEFAEPVLFLIRRDGRMDMYEKATAGKFIYEHSNGKQRFIELRPADQVTFDYADRKVRAYVAHEDRPFAGWDDPIVDSETVMLGYESTKATDLKYQERIESLKNKAKMTWVWIIIGIAFAFMIGAFAWSTWIAPAMAQKAQQQAQIVAPALGIGLIRVVANRKIYKN